MSQPARRAGKFEARPPGREAHAGADTRHSREHRTGDYAWPAKEELGLHEGGEDARTQGRLNSAPWVNTYIIPIARGMVGKRLMYRDLVAN